MRLSCWAFLAFQHSPFAAHWHDLDAAKVSIFANMPFLLQLRAQAADVWRQFSVIWLFKGLLA